MSERSAPTAESTRPKATHAIRSGTRDRVGFTEFVLLIAALMACQAISIDAMLPALPTIGRALGVTNADRAQWIVYAYVAGLGCGQLVWGMVSDRFGRRRILLVGLALYALAALMCATTTDFNALLGWRFIHGVVASTSVVGRSVVRDEYSGARMARVMSLTFIVFLCSPIVAPSLGQLLLLVASWRYLFVMTGAFAALIWIWLALRLPETLHPEHRMRLDAARIRRTMVLVLGNRLALCYSVAAACVFGALMAYLGMVQQIFAVVFHRPQLMTTVFAVCAAAMGVASYLNSRMVERLGMRMISHAALLAMTVLGGLSVLLTLLGLYDLTSFIVLQSLTLACVGLTTANFGTLAMEPMGSVAGTAASVQGFIYTLGGALLAALIGREFAGSLLPLTAGTALCGLAGIVFVLLAEQGRLFREESPGLKYGAVSPPEAL